MVARGNFFHTSLVNRGLFSIGYGVYGQEGYSYGDDDGGDYWTTRGATTRLTCGMGCWGIGGD